MANVGDGYFDLSPTDRSMAILDRTSPVALHVVWGLTGSVDFQALEWAWQALARIHPILGCTADVDFHSTWRPGREPTPIRLLDDGGRLDQLIAADLAVPLNLAKGPLVRLTAIRQPDGYRFVLAAHHAALDGMASLLLLEDLRRVYLERLLTASPASFQPDLSPRTVGWAIRHSGVPLLTRQAVISKSLDRWRRLPPSTHVDPSTGPSRIATDYVTIDMGPVLAVLDEQRRRNSWPVDALLVGILEAAWTETFGYRGDGADGWLVAHDLRRELGLKRGMGNLSGAEPIAIRQPNLRPVERVIEQAAAELAAARSGMPGLGPELMARSWAWMPPSALNRGTNMVIRAGQRNRYTRTLSNLGRLPTSLAVWGPARMDVNSYLGPLSRGPYTTFMAFAQGPSSWLTVRVSEDWLTRSRAMQLGAAIHRLSGIPDQSVAGVV